MKKHFVCFLVCIVNLPVLCQYRQDKPGISDVSYHIDKNTAVIQYSIRSTRPSDVFRVWLGYNAPTDKIPSNNIEGDIGIVKPGVRTIRWNLNENINVFSDKDTISLYAQVVPNVETGKALGLSLLYPGAGNKNLNPQKKYWWIGAIGYGLVASSLFMHSSANNEYDKIHQALTPDEADELYNSALQKRSLGYGLAAGAGLVWTVDLVSVLSAAKKKKAMRIHHRDIPVKHISVLSWQLDIKKLQVLIALNSKKTDTISFTDNIPPDITIVSPDAGNDTIVLHFENNPSVNSRSTDITISSTGLQNKTIIITQAGKELTLAISTNTQSLTSQAGSFSFEVVSNTDWTIVNSEDWLHPDKTSGQENDSITIHYDENTSTGTRNAEISIDGGDAGTKTISVTQDGKTPDEKYVTIHFQEEWASAQKDSLKFEIESNTHWTTSEYANWFTLYPAVGDGDATITIEYDENTATEERSEKISINGTGVGLQSVTFTQSGADPLLLVSTNEITVSSAQGSITFDITSNLDWNVAEPETWLSAAPASGNGNGTITITYEENTQTIPRSLYIKVTALDVPEQTIVFTQEKPGETTGTVEDVDGNTYETVKIGEQWWMAENLATTQYNDNTEIPLVEDAGEWANLSTPAYCWYDNDDGVMKEEYGGLYNWHVVETGKVCPTGWHVPTDKEWKEMEMHLGMSRSDADDFGYRGEGIATKLKSTYGWDDGNGTNESGFNALPGGYRNNTDGSFYFDEWNGNWWTNTPSGDEYAWNREMFYNKDGVRRFDYDRKTGFSIRCVKD